MAAINNLTAMADPYPVGDVESFSFSFTGGAGGPYTWVVSLLEPSVIAMDVGETNTGTGTTFGFDGLMVSPGTGGYLVEVHDAGDDSMTYEFVNFDVIPVVILVRDTDGDLDDSDAYHLTKADTTVADVTLTLIVSAANRGNTWWAFKNSDGANDLIIEVPSGENMNSVPDGTLTLGPGESCYLHADNFDGFDSVGGP